MKVCRVNPPGELDAPRYGSLAPPPSPRSPSELVLAPKLDGKESSYLSKAPFDVASLLAKYGSSCAAVPRLEWPVPAESNGQTSATGSTASPWSQASTSTPWKKACSSSSSGLHHSSIKCARSRAGIGLGALLRAGIAEGATADAVATPFGLGNLVATRPDSGMRTVRYSWGYAYLGPGTVDSSRTAVLESQLHTLESIFGVLVKTLPVSTNLEESSLEQRCKSGLFPEEAASAVASMASVRTLMVWLEEAAREPMPDQREDLLDIAVLLSGLVRTRTELTRLRGQASDPQLDAERNVADAVRIHLGLLERIATRPQPQGPREGVAETCRQWRRLLQHITAPPHLSEQDSESRRGVSVEAMPQSTSPMFRSRVHSVDSVAAVTMARPFSASRVHQVRRSPSPHMRYTNGAVIARVSYSSPQRRTSPAPTRYQRPQRLCSSPVVSSLPSGGVSVATAAAQSARSSTDSFVPVTTSLSRSSSYAPPCVMTSSGPDRPSTVTYVGSVSPGHSSPGYTKTSFPTTARFASPWRRSDGTPSRRSGQVSPGPPRRPSSVVCTGPSRRPSSSARSPTPSVRSPTPTVSARQSLNTARHSPSPQFPRAMTPVLSSARRRRPSSSRHMCGSLEAGALSPVPGPHVPAPQPQSQSPPVPPGSPAMGFFTPSASPLARRREELVQRFPFGMSAS